MWEEKKGRNKMWGEKPLKWTCKEPDEITQATLNVHVVYVASPSTSDPYVPLLLPHERLIRSWHPLATAAKYTSIHISINTEA